MILQVLSQLGHILNFWKTIGVQAKKWRQNYSMLPDREKGMLPDRDALPPAESIGTPMWQISC